MKPWILSSALYALEDKLALRSLQERGFLTINIHVSRRRAESLVRQNVARFEGRHIRPVTSPVRQGDRQ